MIAQLIKFDDIASIRVVRFESTWHMVAKDIVALCGYDDVERALERYCENSRSSCLIDTFRGKIMMDIVTLTGAQRLVTNSPLEKGDKERLVHWYSITSFALASEPVGDETSKSYWQHESIRLLYLHEQEKMAGVRDDYWRDVVSQEEIDTQMVPDTTVEHIKKV